MIRSVTFIVCLFVGFSQAITLKELFERESNEGRTYGVIVDCGSSGTRAHIYEWDTALDFPELLQDISPMKDENGKAVTMKKTPGLSSIANEPSKAAEYIDEVLDFIVDNIPESRFNYTCIYVMATAGMRLLDKDTQDEIMHNIRSYIEELYEFAKVRTYVITGAQEGMYQWIGVNSKAKRFLQPLMNGHKTKTYAVIEMGGASLQVTYQLTPAMHHIVPKRLRKPDIKKVYEEQIVIPLISRESTDPEHDYTLHSTTFLGFGSNSSREAFYDMLIQEVRLSPFFKIKDAFNSFVMKEKYNPFRFTDPCMPVGFNETFRKPTRMLKSRKTIGFLVEEDEETFEYTMVGGGDYDKCRKKVETLLTLAKKEGLNCEKGKSCTMSLLGTPFVPFERFDFLAIGDFYYTMSNEMLDLAGTYQDLAVREQTKAICESSYTSLVKMFPAAIKFDKTRHSSECFKAVWIDTFLQKGLLMPEYFDQLETVGQVNGEPLEWTLGAVMDKSLAIERATESS